MVFGILKKDYLVCFPSLLIAFFVHSQQNNLCRKIRSARPGCLLSATKQCTLGHTTACNTEHNSLLYRTEQCVIQNRTVHYGEQNSAVQNSAGPYSQGTAQWTVYYPAHSRPVDTLEVRVTQAGLVCTHKCVNAFFFFRELG